MKCTLQIDPQREEEVLLYAREESFLTDAILRLCREEPAPLLGYREGEIRPPGYEHCFLLYHGGREVRLLSLRGRCIRLT